MNRALRPAHHSARDNSQVPRGCLGPAKPLSIAAIDAAISETIGAPVRRDRLARDDRVYRWVVRRAIAEGTLRFNTTYAEAAAGAGYPVPRLNCRVNRREARHLRVSTVYRALRSLELAGLVRFHGVKRKGKWRCLSVGLTPAGYGRPPAGRSRRRPTRDAHGRISFLRRNGTSPSVATAKRRPESVSVRARAREGPTTGDEEEVSAFLAAALSPLQPDDRPSGPSAWPHERFDVSDTAAVELVELFEDAFGLPARFSYERHGPQLRRILERFDRCAVAVPGMRRGEGLRRLADRVRRWGQLYRAGNRNVAHVQSLPYFLPWLDQESKRLRRTYKRRAAEWSAEEER